MSQAKHEANLARIGQVLSALGVSRWSPQMLTGQADAAGDLRLSLTRPLDITAMGGDGALQDEDGNWLVIADSVRIDDGDVMP